MINQAFQDLIYEKIPIAEAFGVTFPVVNAEKVIIKAPFSKNKTFKNTAFGGSLHAVATLACWSYLYHQLPKDAFEIVIVSSHVDYVLPVTTDLIAECKAPAPESWASFLKMLDRKGKARLQLKATLFQDGKLCLDYEGTFAALIKTGPASQL